MRFVSMPSNIEVITKMYAKINVAIMEADEESKALNRDKIDNIYLMSFTAVTATKSANEKGVGHA